MKCIYTASGSLLHFVSLESAPQTSTIKSIRCGDQVTSLWCSTVGDRINTLLVNELDWEIGGQRAAFPVEITLANGSFHKAPTSEHDTPGAS